MSETATKIADAVNDATNRSNYDDHHATAWTAADGSLARVYFKSNSRAARDLGYVQVNPDGSLRDGLTKQRKAIRRRLAALGFEVQS